MATDILLSTFLDLVGITEFPHKTLDECTICLMLVICVTCFCFLTVFSYMLLVNLLNHNCFSLDDLLHRLYCMVINMSYQQINTDTCLRTLLLCANFMTQLS